MGQNRLLVLVQQDRSKAVVELQAARAQAARDQAQLEEVAVSLATMNENEQRLTELERARTTLEDAYRAAVKVRDERQVTESVQTGRQANVRILQSPVVPFQPRPTRLLILGAGILLGLFGSITTGLISHYFRRVYLLPEALEIDTGLRVLTCIPAHPCFADAGLLLRPK